MFQLVQKERYFDRDAPEHAHLGMRILDRIDVSELPAFALEQRAGEVAVCIKEILDREELPPWTEIPDENDILDAGGFEKLSRWRVPGTLHHQFFSHFDGTVGGAVCGLRCQ